MGCLGMLSLGALATADLADAPGRDPSFSARAAWVLDTGNRLHYTVHIVAGRLLDVCPCTRATADRQYWRARYHAVTPLQRAVALDPHPSTLADWTDYLTGPADVGFAWVGDAMSWFIQTHVVPGA
jgi:hypothetical protein